MPRILAVGFIVAASQLVGVATSSFLSLNEKYDLLAVWANVEALLALLTAVLFFGHQHTLNRDLVRCKSASGRCELIRDTQGVIFSLSIPLMLGLLFISFLKGDERYAWLALVTGLIALSPDFSLYGLSKPVHAGVISLLKIGVPSLVLFVIVLLGFDDINFLFFGLVLAYFLAAVFVLKFTSIGLAFPRVGVYKLREYLLGYKLGIPTFILTGLRTIPIILATSIFEAFSVAFLILFYKYFLLGVGVKRLIVQTYYKRISEKFFAIRVDVLCSLLAIVGGAVTLFFSEWLMGVIGFQIGKDSEAFLMCVLLVFLNFLGVTSGTRIILLGRDGLYFSVHMFALICMGFLLAAGWYYESLSLIFYGGVVSECVLALGLLIGRVCCETRARCESAR